MQSPAIKKLLMAEGLVVIDIKDVEKLGDAEQIDDALIGRQKLEIAAVSPKRRKAAHDFAQSRTVQIGDLGQIQDDALCFLFGEGRPPPA